MSMNKQGKRIYSNIGFKITLDLGDQVTIFLDFTLSISDGTFQPYRKPFFLINFNKYKLRPPISYFKNILTITQKRLTSLSFLIFPGHL